MSLEIGILYTCSWKIKKDGSNLISTHRTTKLDWRSVSSRAKVIGTLISIAGVVVVELYKGPFIRKSHVDHLKVIPKLFVFYSSPDRWILGGLLLAAASLSNSMWNVIQVHTSQSRTRVLQTIVQFIYYCYWYIRTDTWTIKF